MTWARSVAILAAAGVIFASAQRVDAGTIRMTLATRILLTPGGLQVEVDTRNEGDEPAFNVAPVIIFRGSELPGKTEALLNRDESRTQAIDVPIGDLAGMQGVWPVFIHVMYADANKHSFEAVHVATVHVGSSEPMHAVTLRLEGTRLSASGRINADVGVTGKPTNVRVTFFGPSSLTMAPQESVLPADPPAALALAATVVNRGTTPGSRLPVFAVAEYDLNGSHDTVVASAMVDIQPEGTSVWPERTIEILIAVLIVTWLALALPALRRRRARNGS